MIRFIVPSERRRNVTAAFAAPVLAVLLAGCQTTGGGTAADGGASLPSLDVAFANPAWDGQNIPKGQHCSKFGGNGATPALDVSGLPPETAEVVVAFNDQSYQPLSYNGGHGKLAFQVSGGSATLPSVPGETSRMPEGVRLVARNRATGSYAEPGYLPPCSGGRNNLYFAVVTAVDANGDPLARSRIDLGRY